MNIKSLVLALAVLSLSSGIVLAQEGMNHEMGMNSMDSAKMSTMNHVDDTAKGLRIATEEDIKSMPNVGNKICPVSGNPVGDGSMGEAAKFVYNGKIYNLCCPMCVKDFKKNPEKYSSIAEQGVKEVK